MSNTTTIKDNILYGLYVKRISMYDILIEAYVLKKNYFHNIVKNFNKKRLVSCNIIEDLKKQLEYLVSDEDKLQVKTFLNYKILPGIIDAYKCKIKFLRETILAANMEYIHFKSMIDKLTQIRKLNIKQLNNYSDTRELEILNLTPGLSGDWTDNEKKTIIDYHNNMNRLDGTFRKMIELIIFNIYNPYDKDIKEFDDISNKLNLNADKKIMEAQKLQKEINEECHSYELKNSKCPEDTSEIFIKKGEEIIYKEK